MPEGEKKTLSFILALALQAAGKRCQLVQLLQFDRSDPGEGRVSVMRYREGKNKKKAFYTLPSLLLSVPGSRYMETIRLS